MSFPRMGGSFQKGFRGPLDQKPIDVCGHGSQRRILNVTVRCALNSALRGDQCPAVGSAAGASWDLTLPLTIPLMGPSTET